jgi:hypothetical protein
MTATSTRRLTPVQAAVLGALPSAGYLTPAGLVRDGGLDPDLSPLAVWRAAESLVRKGIAVKGAAGGIGRNTGYRAAPAPALPASLAALRASCAAAGITAESPDMPDDEAERLYALERADYEIG